MKPETGREENGKAYWATGCIANMSAGPTEPVDRSPEPAVEPEPPRRESYTMSHNRTPPSEDASGGEVQEVAASHEGATGDEVEGGETDDEDRRAHEHIDDKRNRVETSEDETITTTISASAPSASCDHPDKDAMTMDPTRPSRDPAGATGNDERRPDKLTEPPDKPEGTGGRDGEVKVETGVPRASRVHADGTGDDSAEMRRPEKPDDSPNEVEGAKVGEVETSLSKALRGVQEGLGDGDDEERRPGVPDEPPDEPYGEPRNPEGVKVEPGGKAGKVERNGCAAHENADAEVDGEVVGIHRDAEVEMESAGTRRGTSVEGERWSVMTHERSSTEADEENNQRTPQDDEDVPGPSQEPPLPVLTPDEPGQRQNKPPSVELEGRREVVRAAMTHLPEPKRTRQERRRVTKTLGTDLRRCRTR